MKEGITLKQTDEAKLERSREILEALKEARGGKLLDSHRVMGNDPNLINMFYQQYVNCNKKDISIPKKYRELIVMAVGIATSTETTMKVHGKLALENGATIDEIFEVIRILFFTCGVTKLLPALETLGDLFEAIDLEENKYKHRYVKQSKLFLTEQYKNAFQKAFL